MSARAWRTGTPRDPGFERAWNAFLERAPYAHFALRLDYLEWNHRLGTPGLAVLVEDPGLCGGIAARLERGEWVSGLPWRWQAAVAADGRSPDTHLLPGEAAALFRHLDRRAEGRRVRAHLPVAPAGAAPGYLAGKTLMHRIDVDDDALIKAMDKTKRSMIRRAEREGYRVVEAATTGEFRAFATVQRETNRRHGQQPLDRPEDEPGPGERWREWELPWMWLLLAVRDGEVRSGFGFALGQGLVLESRAAASTADALRSGAFVLLAFEAARRARERGYRYLNWGGDTFFKRDVSGALATRVELHRWLGGGSRWAAANHGESLALALRQRVSGAVQSLRARAAAASPGTMAPKPKPKRSAAPTLQTWDTREPLDPGFAERWQSRIEASPLTNFSLALEVLAWEARHGRHSRAVLAEEGERCGGIVLREVRGRWVSGWPWRWQAVLAGSLAARPVGFDAAEAAWLFERARAAAGDRPLRCFLPHAPPAGVRGYPAGRTIVQAIDRDDEELLQSMGRSKRRIVRRARDLGYEVLEARTLEDFLAFHRIQDETRRRRGEPAASPPSAPGPGEGWREWEHAWMWLLLARRDGSVHAGAGDSLVPGGMIDGRTAASSAEGRRQGAFALLCFEEARRGRDRGHRWLNHGGDTYFKREISGRLGESIRVWGWLAGGGAFGAADAAEAVAGTVPPVLARWIGRRRGAGS